MNCLIVGCGCSGLTCGILLARHGYKVTILEQNKNIAPTINGFTRSGRYYDTGMHCLGGISEGGSLKRQIDSLELKEKITFSIPRPEQSFTFILPNNTRWLMPQGFEDINKSLSNLFPDESDQIQSFLQLVQKASQQFQYGYDLESVELEKLADQPLNIVLDNYFSNADLKLLLSSLSLSFCGLTSKETSFWFYGASTGSYFHSYGQINAGGRELVKNMQDEFLSLGGQIITKTKVQKINIDQNKTFKEVELEGGTILKGDILINTFHPNLLEALLPAKALRPIQKQYLSELDSTESILAVFANVPAKTISDLGNILIIAENGGKHLTIFPAIHNSVGTITIMQPASYDKWQEFAETEPFRRKNGYKEKKVEQAKKLIDLVVQHLPQLKDLISIDSISTPLTIKDHCMAPKGTSYGVKQSVNQYPPMPKLPLRNIFLSGQALAGPGIQGAITAGFITAETIIKEQAGKA